MPTREPKNELQSQLYSWGAWVRTRKYIVREFMPPAFANVLAKLMPRPGGVQRNTFLDRDGAIFWGLWRAMGAESNDTSQSRAAALWLIYVLGLKLECAAIELQMPLTSFFRLLAAAETDIGRRRRIFVEATQMMEKADVRLCEVD